MNLTFSELDWRGPSPKLWSGFAPPAAGSFQSTASGNPAIGLFDDFLGYSGLSQTTGYYILGTGTGTCERGASNYDASTAAQKLATGLGVVDFLATADNDEAVLAWGGNASEAMFKLDASVGYGDLCFECRFLSDILLADDWAWFIGLIEGGGQATTKCFDGGQDPAGTHDQLGFLKLMAGTTAVGTYCITQGGAADQGTAAIHTNVASQYVKLGFKWESLTNLVKFFVNGEEQTSYRINGSTVTAGTFPDDEYMTPIACVVTDQATDMTGSLDWWACAQAVGHDLL